MRKSFGALRLTARLTRCVIRTGGVRRTLDRSISQVLGRKVFAQSNGKALICRGYSSEDTSEKDLKKMEEGNYLLPHPIWPGEYIDKIQQTHRDCSAFSDKLAYGIIKAMRFNFDWMSGFSRGKLTKNKWLTRMIFLESVAGVPGSIAATVRHLKSLRSFSRDHGWIHTLLEEAENERMHLLVALKLKQPGRLFRFCTLITQGIFFNFFWVSYLSSPSFCHRLVGYLEEEAVRTYSHCIEEIADGKSLADWQTEPAPAIAIKYWKLSSKATMKDVIRVIRADEAHHRDVNHTFASMKLTDSNPFKPGE